MPNHKGKTSIKRDGKQKLFLSALLLLAVLVLTFGIHQAFKNNTPGIDFYVYWQSGKAFFMEGLDPYSDEVSTQIQYGIFGRAALPEEDPMHFANPAYALLAVFPWLFLSFDWAQAAWLAFNLLAIFTVLFISFPLAPRWVLLLTPFFYQVVFGLVLGNFAVLVFTSLTLTFSLLTREKNLSGSGQVFLGLLLAWITIKPQSVWLYLFLLLLSALRKKYYPLLAGFIGGWAVMVAAAFLVRADWFTSWLERVLGYSGYLNYQPSREFYLGLLFPPDVVSTLSIILAAFLLSTAAVFIYLWMKGRVSLLLTLSWCGLAIYFIHPNSLSYEQLVLLLPPLLWAARQKGAQKERLFFWLGGWVFSYTALLAGFWLQKPWIVSHLPLTAYLVWMIWLHVREFSKKRYPGAAS